MNVNLTGGELVVLAEQLELDPGFAVGQRSEEETERLREEGWRSLLARGLVRMTDESVEVSSELESVAADVLSPRGIVVYTRAEGDTAAVSTVLVGKERMLDAMPIANDVMAFSSTDAESVVRAITSAAEKAESAAVHRLDAFARAGDPPERSIAWAMGPDGKLFGIDEEPAEEISLDAIRAGVVDVVSSVDHNASIEGSGQSD